LCLLFQSFALALSESIGGIWFMVDDDL